MLRIDPTVKEGDVRHVLGHLPKSLTGAAEQIRRKVAELPRDCSRWRSEVDGRDLPGWSWPLMPPARNSRSQ